jgi:gliding motility-associated-like protein
MKKLLLTACISISLLFGLKAQVTADFTADITEGCNSIVVSFQNLSSPLAGSDFFWDFGNGQTSTLENPTIAFTNPGFYTVRLTVTNGPDSDTQTKDDFIKVFNKPEVHIGVDGSITGCAPLSIQFSDNTIPGDAPVETWYWDFGDGTISSEQNPAHSFNYQNEFQVSLTVTDTNNCLSIGYYDELISAFKPHSNFSGNPRSSCLTPLEVNFSNSSSGSGNLSYEWDFGDGNTTDQADPSHTYLNNGKYSVSLITYDEYMCSDTLTKVDYVNLSGLYTHFTIQRDTLCKNETIEIENLCENAATYYWDFGDGTTFHIKNPVHAYSNPGEYTISLTTTHQYGCSGEFSIDVYVEDITADFSISDPFACEVPALIQYTNNSENAVNYEWHFGNGEVSTDSNPTVIFEDFGNFSDTLYAYSSAGCVSKKVYSNSVHILNPKAYFKPNIWVDKYDIMGCAPLEVEFTHASVYGTEFDQITEFYWDFGDGSQSTEEHPRHIFEDVGIYNVSMYFKTERGCTSTVYYAQAKTGTVQSTEFTKDVPDTICASQPVNFTDLSQDSTLVNEWFWNFGDSCYSFKKNPTHVFTDTGSMDVYLISYYNGCMSYELKEDYIYVRGPIVEMEYEYNCENPYTVQFFGNALGADKLKWSFGDLTPVDSVNFNPVHKYPQNLTYYPTLIAENSENGCSYISEGVINIKDIKADFTISDSIGCTGLNVLLKTNCSDHYFYTDDRKYGKYHWDFGDGSSSVVNADTLFHKFNSKGEFEVKLKVSDIHGCKDSLIKSVKTYRPAVHFFAGNSSGCMPMVVPFKDVSESDTTLISWNWNFGDGENSSDTDPEHTYQNFGMYDVSLTVTDAIGCSSSKTVNNYIEALKPIPDFVVDENNICLGQAAIFTPLDTGNVVSYYWEFGDGSVSYETYPQHIYPHEGYFDVSLTLIDNHGCDSTMHIKNLMYLQTIPEPDFSSDNPSAECYPLQVNFSDITDNPDVIQWYWEFGDGQTSSDLPNPTRLYTSPGNYDVLLRLTSSNGCVGELLREDYISINGPVADMTVADTACRNESIVFMAENQQDVYELEWIFGNGNSSQNDIAYNSYDLTGYMYPVLIIKSDTIGTCDIYLTDSIYIPALDPEIVFDTGNPHGCIPFDLYASNYCPEADQWTWKANGQTIGTGSNLNHLFESPGERELKLYIYDDSGCKDSSAYVVEAFPLPNVKAMDNDFVCRGDELTLSASGAISYDWLPKQWMVNENGNTPIAKPDSTITYIVNGTDENGCVNQSQVTIVVQQEPFVPNLDTAVIIGEEVILNVASDDIATYNWFPNYEIDCSNCSEVIVKPLEPTTYEVSVTDTASCFSLTYDVFVDIIKKYTVDVPKAFTPNNDGVNDLLFVKGWGIDELILFRITNRYGEIVFETSDKNEAWDGTYKGMKQDVETYKYYVSVKTYEDEIITKSGTVKLLK